MAKSRVEKNQKLYETLDREMKNSKENIYEEKLKSIDPNIDNGLEENNNFSAIEKTSKKSEVKTNSALTIIAKEINGKKEKKNELVKVKGNKEEPKKLIEEKEEDVFQDPISFTDKLSVEEILRAKLEQQEKIRNDKRNKKKSPCDETYTPEMMQERIMQHKGIDIRKETKVVTHDFKWVALSLLIMALIAVIIVGCLIIFKIIEI